jgi:hypothetical protein
MSHKIKYHLKSFPFSATGTVKVKDYFLLDINFLQTEKINEYGNPISSPEATPKLSKNVQNSNICIMSLLVGKAVKSQLIVRKILPFSAEFKPSNLPLSNSNLRPTA